MSLEFDGTGVFGAQNDEQFDLCFKIRRTIKRLGFVERDVYEHVSTAMSIYAAAREWMPVPIYSFGTWVITSYGIECLTRVYSLHARQLTDPYLHENVTGKIWVVKQDFEETHRSALIVREDLEKLAIIRWGEFGERKSPPHRRR